LSKLPDHLSLPRGRNEWEERLIRVLNDYTTQVSRTVNDLSTNRRAVLFNETSVAPTSGLFAKGDFVPKKDPEESGTVGDKYIMYGWLCIQEGSASASSFKAVSYMTNN
jgi:hypothetical protein